MKLGRGSVNWSQPTVSPGANVSRAGMICWWNVVSHTVPHEKHFFTVLYCSKFEMWKQKPF